MWKAFQNSERAIVWRIFTFCEQDPIFYDQVFPLTQKDEAILETEQKVDVAMLCWLLKENSLKNNQVESTNG